MKKIGVLVVFCLVMLMGTLYAVDATWGNVFLQGATNYEIFHHQNNIAIISDLAEGTGLDANLRTANQLVERYTVYLPIHVQINADGKINGATWMRKGEALSTEKALDVKEENGILEVCIDQQVGTPKGVGMIPEVVYPQQKIYEYQLNWNVNSRVEKVMNLRVVLLNQAVATRYDTIYQNLLNQNYRDIYGSIMAMTNSELHVLETYLTAKYDVLWDVDGMLVEGMRAQNANQSENNEVTEKPVFVDVQADYWARQMIEDMANAGYLKGYEDNTFRPENQLTRAEAAQVLVRFFDWPLAETKEFQDINQSHWAYDAVQRVQKYMPTTENNFEPDVSITRKDFVLAIMNAKNSVEENLENTFTDLQGLTSEEQNKILTACHAGIIKGYEDGTFRPEGFLTRAEACTILARVQK